MPFFHLGYFVGTFVTKTVRAFVDPHPPAPSQFNYSKSARHKYELEAPLPVQQPEATSQTLPGAASVPPVTSEETQRLQRLGENVMMFTLPLRRQSPKRRQRPCLVRLKQLGTWCNRNIMENTYILGGASAFGLVGLPYIRATMSGGSFWTEAAVSAVCRVTQAGIVAAAPAAYSIAQRGIVTAAPKARKAASSMTRVGTAAISVVPLVTNGVKQTFRLSCILLVQIFLMCFLFIAFIRRAICEGLTVLTARGDANLILEDIVRHHNLGGHSEMLSTEDDR